MNTCKECGSKRYVLSFLTHNGVDMVKDTYCIECVLGKMYMLFGDDTQQIIKDFFEINELKENVEIRKGNLAWKVKHILSRDHLTPEGAKEFVYGVSYKALIDDDGGEEKSEDK
jgi:hypothetical protein